MFFYGEDSVTDNLSPYIDAAPQGGAEVLPRDPAGRRGPPLRLLPPLLPGRDRRRRVDLLDGLAYTEPQLNWGYRQVFDRLDRMADELRKDRSLPKFAQAIALYHMVVEATLAQPGQHFIEDFFTKDGTMPGFNEGMKNVSRDEQRHIGFGVKVLSECFAESDECKAAVVELLREVLPYSVAVFSPPNWDREYTRCYGFELEDIYAFGLRSVRTKWRAAGYPIERDARRRAARSTPSSRPRRSRAEQIKLLKAGVMGEPIGRPDSSPEIQRALLRRHRALARTTGRERQPDHDPVALHRRRRPGTCVSTTARPRPSRGEAPDADLTFETSWSDWIGVSTKGGDPRRAVLRRRIRPRGSLRNLIRLQKVFPARPARLS